MRAVHTRKHEIEVIVEEVLIRKVPRGDDGGITSGTVNVSVQGADETLLWQQYVNGKVGLPPHESHTLISTCAKALWLAIAHSPCSSLSVRTCRVHFATVTIMPKLNVHYP